VATPDLVGEDHRGLPGTGRRRRAVRSAGRAVARTARQARLSLL